MKVRREELFSRAILFLTQEIQNITERMLKPYNVTHEQLWVLRCLSENNTKLTQKEICQKISKTPANISRIIDRLESKSFVIRQSSPSDRRVYFVVLTRQGRSLLQEVDGVLEYFSSKFSSGIDSKTLNSTKQTLDIMGANIASMSKEFRK